MRFQSALILGLSFLTAFAAAETPASNSVSISVDEKDLSHRPLRRAQDAIVGSLHEVEERALHRISPPKPPKGGITSATKKTSSAIVPIASSTTASILASPTSAIQTSSTIVTIASSTTTSTSASPTSTIQTSTIQTSSTIVTIASSTTASTSASSTSTIQPRVRCGEAGNTCTDNSCDLARSLDLRQAINRRAYGAPTGQIRNLINRKGNTKLSDPSKRDAWIDFGTDPASVTIGGLTGCTAVIAISEKGMYAFHIWEAGDGDTLDPAKYMTTLANIQSKLASKMAELAGGQLYLYLPTNPDQSGQLLYDSTRWTSDLTDETSEPVPAGNTKWTTQVKRVAAIQNAIVQGSGLSITMQTTYEAPAKGAKRSPDWMTAQFDPAASANTRQFGVWTSTNNQIAQHEWMPAAAGSSS